MGLEVWTVRALTVCQPYAHLIISTAAELARAGAGDYPKRVENREWERPVSVRGPLLIHAGKSRAWLRPGDEQRYPRMAFGALVGCCDLVACYSISAIRSGQLPPHLAWVKTHLHTHGPVCLILGDVKRFNQPVDCRGRQGFFDVQIGLILEHALAHAIPIR
jgi:hypothetical protein